MAPAQLVVFIEKQAGEGMTPSPSEERNCLHRVHLWSKLKAFYWGHDEPCASLHLIEVSRTLASPPKRLAPCCASTCGKRPKRFIEDMNFETRQRCVTRPPSKQNKTRFTCQLPTMGALVCIGQFQVFCGDYSYPWNTNPRRFPPRQEWGPRGP